MDPNTGSVSRRRYVPSGDPLNPIKLEFAPATPQDMQDYLERRTGARANYQPGLMSPEERWERGMLPQTGPTLKGSAEDPYASFPPPSALARSMLQVIAPGEGANDPAARQAGLSGCDAVYANGRYGLPPQPISTMTVDDVIAFGKRMIEAERLEAARLHKPFPHGFAPVGLYQINIDTLKDYRDRLSLPGDAVMTPDLQERIAARRLTEAGLDKYMNGALSLADFQRKLSGAWSSIESPKHSGRTKWTQIQAVLDANRSPGRQDSPPPSRSSLSR